MSSPAPFFPSPDPVALRRVCVFCGSSSGDNPEYAAAARALGALLAKRGLTLVYGGGHVGLMGVVADGALEADGDVIGVIPRRLHDWEVGHQSLTELHVVETMHERKAMMANLACAFIALPGGIGTLEEIFEAWTWTQLGYHDKQIGLLNTAGFYDPLIAFMDLVRDRGFLTQEKRALLHVGDTPEALLDRIARPQNAAS